VQARLSSPLPPRCRQYRSLGARPPASIVPHPATQPPSHPAIQPPSHPTTQPPTRTVPQHHQGVLSSDRHSFEVLGYDVLIDADLRPWLIEVNASPSLASTGEEDRGLKADVLDAAIELACPPGWALGYTASGGGGRRDGDGSSDPEAARERARLERECAALWAAGIDPHGVEARRHRRYPRRCGPLDLLVDEGQGGASG